MQRCSKGIWDETIPGIQFDEHGVSNFCKLQESLMQAYPRGEKGLADWMDIVKKIKEKGKGKKYDCIIGVSGGVDSSYLLHMAKEYGLRPLAVHLDNGFDSEIAVNNIYKVTSKLGIDLETYVIDYEEVQVVLKSYILASLPWIDSPTDIAIKAILYKIAVREKIKFILNGSDFRSEGKQPFSWTHSDTRQLKFLVKKFFPGFKLKSFPLQPLHSWLYYGMIRKIKVIRPLYFLPYAKRDARKLLAEKYDWTDYGGHHYENIFTRFAISYWMPAKFGIDKRLITYSAQILSGELKREDAIKLVSNLPYNPETIQHDIDYILKKLNLSKSEFEKAFHAENKYFYDYPSYFPIIKRFSKIGKFFSKKIFSFKPGIFEAIDQNIIK